MPIYTVVTQSGPHPLSTPWASRFCLLRTGHCRDMQLYKQICLEVRGGGGLLAGAVHRDRQKRKAGLQLTTSDILGGNRSSFLWIALSFISLQINLVIVGDSLAATAGFFSAVSEAQARGGVSILYLCHFLTCFASFIYKCHLLWCLDPGV